MITLPRGIVVTKKIYTTFAVVGVLAAAFYLGRRPSPVYLLAPIGAAALLALLRFPRLGLLATITVALLIPIAISTGTEVSLNLSALAVPGVFLVWLLTRLQAGSLDFTPSRTNRPLILFLLLALLSIFIGNAIWDPAVPRSDKFIIVQLAQWALFAFSAAIYWLVGNLVKEQVWLKRLAALFLLIAGGLAYYVHWGRASKSKPRRRQAREQGEGDSTGVYCPQCGSRAKLSDRFCRTCGGRLRREG